MDFQSTALILNENDPLNVAAGRYLPADWKDSGVLNILALAQWGLEEGISVETLGPSVMDDAVAARLTLLRAIDPTEVMSDLESDGQGTTVLNLDDATSARQAATWVLESIRASIER